MVNQTQSIAINKLLAHPGNPNVMGEEKFRKLVRNIERTGLYEPIVVRPHPKKKGCFEIINGHHRVKALQQLGREEADCVVWDVDDEQAAVLLATLNRLTGSDEPGKKIELLKQLSKRLSSPELAKLLPQTKKQIEQLTRLKLSDVHIKTTAESFAIPLVFFVSRQQQEIIENAIETACRQTVTPSEVEGSVKTDSSTRPDKSGLARNDGMTRVQRRAAAITQIAEHFLSAALPQSHQDAKKNNN